MIGDLQMQIHITTGLQFFAYQISLPKTLKFTQV